MNDRPTLRIGEPLGRFRHCPGGSAAAEFALVVPFLVLLLFGTIEVGRGMHDYQLVDKSIRHATRYLSRVNMDCGAGFDIVDQNNAKNLALTGTIDGSGDYLLKYWTSPGTINIIPGCIDNSTLPRKYQGAFNADQVRTVTVTANVPIFLNFGSSWLGNLSIDVVVRHEEVVFGE